ncbi:hypothetical protein ACFVYR_05245 [Streptomyces sp. NPDC058284]|uniref:hypothetical protein n=1 Tax=unclassified Streptomyces TaxID=2593676 RepID=UPI00364FB79C
MDQLFWGGLVLGAVFGVGVDLWKRPLDRLLDRRLEHRTVTRTENLARQLRQDRGALRDYLVEVILQTTLIGSLIGLLAGIMFSVGTLAIWVNPDPAADSVNIALSVVGQLLSVVGAGYIIRIAGDALTVARRVSQLRAEDESRRNPPSPPP